MAVVAVLEIHMERKAVVIIKPNINLRVIVALSIIDVSVILEEYIK